MYVPDKVLIAVIYVLCCILLMQYAVFHSAVYAVIYFLNGWWAPGNAILIILADHMIPDLDNQYYLGWNSPAIRL